MGLALIDQFIQFLILRISVASVDEGAAEGTIGVDLAVEVVTRHLTGLAVHFLRLADLAPRTNLEVSLHLLDHA